MQTACPCPQARCIRCGKASTKAPCTLLAAGPSGELQITYTAGANLAAYPSVRNWLLLHIGTVYAQRESLVIGASVAELPATYLDSMLSDITVPPRF